MTGPTWPWTIASPVGTATSVSAITTAPSATVGLPISEYTVSKTPASEMWSRASQVAFAIGSARACHGQKNTKNVGGYRSLWALR